VNFGGNPTSSLTCVSQIRFFFFVALEAILCSQAEDAGYVFNLREVGGQVTVNRTKENNRVHSLTIE
jgi:hypothetical protein